MDGKIIRVVDPLENIGSTTLKALELPIKIDVSIMEEINGGIIHLSTKDKDEYKIVCETYINSWSKKPKGLKELLSLNKTEKYIAGQIAEWIDTFIREGKFYLNESRTEYVCVFDLEQVGDKATRILDNFYKKWNQEQSGLNNPREKKGITDPSLF